MPPRYACSSTALLKRAQENGARLAKERAGLAALSATELAKLHAERSGRWANNLALRGSVGRGRQGAESMARAPGGGHPQLAKFCGLHPSAEELDGDEAERWNAVLAADSTPSVAPAAQENDEEPAYAPLVKLHKNHRDRAAWARRLDRQPAR